MKNASCPLLKAGGSIKEVPQCVQLIEFQCLNNANSVLLSHRGAIGDNVSSRKSVTRTHPSHNI